MNKVKHPVMKFIKFSFKADKKYYFLVLLNCIINALLTVFNSYSLSLIIATCEKGDYTSSLYIGGAIALINVLFYFLCKLLSSRIEIETQVMNNRVNEELCYILTRVEFQAIEDPYYLELTERAKQAIENQGCIFGFISSLASLLQGIITLFGLMTVILTFDYIVLIIIFVSFVIFTGLTLLSLKTQVKFFNDLIPINRRFGYYLTILTEPRYGKDFRFYPIGKFMNKKFEDYGDEQAKYFKRFGNILGLVGAAQSVLKVIENILIYSYLILKTIKNSLPVSKFSLFISCALSFSSVIESMVNTSTSFLRHSQYVAPIMELVELPLPLEKKDAIPFEGEIETIEFRNVSFTYPRTTSKILDNVSFKINKGEKISVVGLNGAGKTTIVKLICRLYKINEGEILVNGVNIDHYNYSSYISKISAVFQDFKLFAYSIKENILNEDGDEKEAYQIACKVGLKEKIDKLDDGINSLYSKSFDEKGIELSGGECQKVAIGRALHSKSSLIILDEPTSALDPLAEAEIYSSFNNLVQNKTALYISHRMSSSVFCDKVLILNNGKVEDFAPHKELIKKKDSLYYKLFTSQAKNYAS
ncbi:MAG: ABC transporter ATP-binding protein [Bacillales bacterium]|nr:ABC transporter ATP-binding protein [Bacillales bacterium]